MLHPRGSGTAARGLLQEAGKGLKAVPGAPGCGSEGGQAGGAGRGLRAQAQPAGTDPPGARTSRGGWGVTNSPERASATQNPLLQRKRPPRSHPHPPGLAQPGPIPRDPLQLPCPARACRSRARISSAALTSRGFQSPSPTGQGAKAWEEPPEASPGPSCPHIGPTEPWQRHRHLQGHVQTHGMEPEAARGWAVTGTKLFLPRALPTGIVTKGAIPGAQLCAGASEQRLTNAREGCCQRGEGLHTNTPVKGVNSPLETFPQSPEILQSWKCLG